MFGVGRFVSAYAMKFIPPQRLMICYGVVNGMLLSLAIVHPGWAGLWAIFATSFFMSIIYPTIFALGVQRFGADSKVGGSFLVMAIIGGAILTPAMGYVADRSGSPATAYLIPAICYGVVTAYSLLSRSIASQGDSEMGGPRVRFSYGDYARINAGSMAWSGGRLCLAVLHG